jgi:hypothetical protein
MTAPAGSLAVGLSTARAEDFSAPQCESAGIKAALTSARDMDENSFLGMTWLLHRSSLPPTTSSIHKGLNGTAEGELK